MKKLLDNGTLSALQMGYCNQVGWFRPQHPWLLIQQESGGMLVEQAIHHLDLWLWIYGRETSVYGYTSHVPLGGTYPLPEEAVENNAATIIHFKDGGIGMMIKSWAAEVEHNGSGMVSSKGPATLLSHGLRWKTHDMVAAEEFIVPVTDDDTYRCLSEGRRQQSGIGAFTPKELALIIG